MNSAGAPGLGPLQAARIIVVQAEATAVIHAVWLAGLGERGQEFLRIKNGMDLCYGRNPMKNPCSKGQEFKEERKILRYFLFNDPIDPLINTEVMLFGLDANSTMEIGFHAKG